MTKPIFKIGETLDNGKYTIEEFIDQGGSGQVFKAWDNDIKGTFRALKVFLTSEEAKELSYEGGKLIKRKGQEGMRKDEIKSRSDLDGVDNLARFFHRFDVKRNGKVYPVLCMEYISGYDLKEKIEQKVSYKAVLNYSIQIAKILSDIHKINYIFGDLTKGNVRITEKNKVKLLDFAHARQTDAAEIAKGSRLYHAPERSFGEQHFSSDNFSFGILLFEMFSGGKHPIEELLEMESPKMELKGKELKNKIEEYLKEAYLINKIKNSKLLDTTYNKKEMEFLENLKSVSFADKTASSGKKIKIPSFVKQREVKYKLPKKYNKNIRKIINKYIKEKSLRKIINRCLEINPEKRYENCEKILKSFEKIVEKKETFKEFATGSGIVFPIIALLFLFSSTYRNSTIRFFKMLKQKVYRTAESKSEPLNPYATKIKESRDDRDVPKNLSEQIYRELRESDVDDSSSPYLAEVKELEVRVKEAKKKLEALDMKVDESQFAGKPILSLEDILLTNKYKEGLSSFRYGPTFYYPLPTYKYKEYLRELKGSQEKINADVKENRAYNSAHRHQLNKEFNEAISVLEDAVNSRVISTRICHELVCLYVQHGMKDASEILEKIQKWVEIENEIIYLDLDSFLDLDSIYTKIESRKKTEDFSTNRMTAEICKILASLYVVPIDFSDYE